MRGASWEAWEDELVIEHVRDLSRLFAELPSKSKEQIKHRRRKLVGRIETGRKFWTSASLKRLESANASGGLKAACAEFPDRLPTSVEGAINRHRMKVSPRSHIKVERADLPPLMIDIRRELHSRAISGRKLCQRIGVSRSVLMPVRVRADGLSHAALGRLVTALGGELYVEWED